MPSSSVAAMCLSTDEQMCTMCNAKITKMPKCLWFDSLAVLDGWSPAQRVRVLWRFFFFLVSHFIHRRVCFVGYRVMCLQSTGVYVLHRAAIEKRAIVFFSMASYIHGRSCAGRAPNAMRAFMFANDSTSTSNWSSIFSIFIHCLTTDGSCFFFFRCHCVQYELVIGMFFSSSVRSFVLRRSSIPVPSLDFVEKPSLFMMIFNAVALEQTSIVYARMDECRRRNNNKLAQLRMRCVATSSERFGKLTVGNRFSKQEKKQRSFYVFVAMASASHIYE